MSEEKANSTWLQWLKEVMIKRPKNNSYLDSERGLEVGKLCLSLEKEFFSWRRSDPSTFWIDVQLFTKYKLSDKEIEFICKMQPGVSQYFENAKERNAYAELKRGLDKLKKLQDIEVEDEEN